MQERRGSTRVFAQMGVACAIMLGVFFSAPANADAPPVRIAVVPSGGSGIEQEAVDRISQGLDGTQGIAISTVNPDWYVVCTISESNDQVSGQIRYNGTVTVKTTDGQVLNTVAVQKYNQDFSLQPGAPLNKRLVDKAAREVIGAMSDRAIPPIQQAVQVELATRERIIQAETFAQEDKYDEAMATLRAVTPDTPRFKAVRELIEHYEVEQEALTAVNAAKTKAQKGQYVEAIGLLKDVKKESKRYKMAQGLIDSNKRALANRAKLGRNKPATKTSTSTTAAGNSDVDAARLKALEARKSALDAEKKAVEMQEAELKSKTTK